jgi:hypothetical protein
MMSEIRDGDDFEIRLPARGNGWFKVRFEEACASCRHVIFEGEWAKRTDGGILCNDCGHEEEAE